MLLDYAVAQIASAHDVSTAVRMASNEYKKHDRWGDYREWVGASVVREALSMRYRHMESTRELVLTLACGCTITLRDYGTNENVPTLVHAPACQDSHAKRHQGALFEEGAIE